LSTGTTPNRSPSCWSLSRGAVSAVAILMAIVATGCQDCDRDHTSPSPVSEELEDQEDRHSAVASDDSGFENVDCIDVDDDIATADTDGQRRTLYGKVLAIDGEASEDDRQGQDPATSPGTAVPDVAIELISPDDTAAALSETITDDQGRWCVSISTDRQLDPPLLAIAELDDLQLRRPIVDDGRNDITAFDEALVRLLIDEGHQFQNLDAADYRRVAEGAREVIADLDVETTSAPSMRSLLSRLVDTMEDDEQLLQISDHLFDGANSER